MNNKTIWKIHSWLGLLAGIPLLVIALTGSVLVFKDEISALLIPELVTVQQPADEAALPLDKRLEALRRDLPEYEVVGWVFYEGEERADFVYVIRRGDSEWLHVYQNPYTGEVLNAPAKTSSELMGWILILHYTFFADHLGMVVCGVIAVFLCLLGISGFLIYRKFWKNFLTFRWKTSLRTLSGDLHKRIGVISAPLIFILGITGAIWNFEHIWQEWQHHEAGEPHDPVMEKRFYNLAVSFDTLVQQSRDEIPEYIVRYIDFPREQGHPITFYGEFEQQSSFRSPYHSTVSFEADTGSVLDHTRIDEASLWAQLYDAFTPLHFGTFGGWTTRIVWCLLGFAPGLLAVSGSFIWWKRGRSSKRVRANRQPAIEQRVCSTRS